MHLEEIIAAPHLLEIDAVDLELPIERAWRIVRHLDLGDRTWVRALFAIRTIPDRLSGRDVPPLKLGIDQLVSTPKEPGFSVLFDDPPHELVVGAIGKVWKPRIPFLHVPSSDAFASFAEPGYVRVGWSITLCEIGRGRTRVAVEVRVHATDDESLRRFRRYFRLIGPASRRIRRSLLAALARAHGTPGSKGGHPFSVTMSADQRAP